MRILYQDDLFLTCYLRCFHEQSFTTELVLPNPLGLTVISQVLVKALSHNLTLITMNNKLINYQLSTNPDKLLQYYDIFDDKNDIGVGFSMVPHDTKLTM